MNDNVNDSGLFAEFPKVSTEQWEEQIKIDLKGADYEKKLIWKTQEGYKIRPYYRSEHLSNLDYLESPPGAFPYTRTSKTINNDWQIREDIDSLEIAEANALAREAIEKGATAIGFNVKFISSNDEMQALLYQIDIEKIAIHFYSAKSYTGICDLFLHEIKRRGCNPKLIQGSFNFDCINYFLLLGSFYTTINNDFVEATNLLKHTSEYLPNYKAINVNGHYFHNAGANLTQEIGFLLASANEYLAQLTAKGLTIDEIGPHLQFSVAIGSNYFLEIAKIRAIRYLWSRIVQEYKPKNLSAGKVSIHGITSIWNKTVYDPYVNILRTTTEAMAAAIAGCDVITVLPFDNTFKKPDAFSRRIARNTQIILKGESHLDEVIDPAAGSYYIENLTDIIASQAWDYFKLIEEKGGFIEVAKENFIKEEIEKSLQQKHFDIATRRQVIVGTNQFPNLTEKMLDKMQPIDSPHAICGLLPTRASLAFEKIRFATEDFINKGGKRPKVFLFNYGNLAMRKARATFISNFFGCAGYEIIDNDGFKSIDDGIAAIKEAKPNMVVFCGADDEYMQFVPQACEAVKSFDNNIFTIVAGNPADVMAAQRNIMLDDFVSIKSNLLNTLEKYHHLLGIL